MRESLLQIDAQSQRVAEIAATNSGGALSGDTNWSFSSDGRSVAFARSSFVSPPDLYIEGFDPVSERLSPPRRLTRFAEKLNFADRVRVEDVSWPSRDGLFTIHGLLATPARKATGPLPTIVFLTGGPGMVRRWFDATGTGLRLAFAAAGYAVLVPNTRGRGGYGDAFLNGLRTGHSYSRLPLNDALDGLNMLVNSHISDPGKLVIAGHSYGGYLTAYAITQTHLFKAAIVLEGHRADLTTFLYAPYYQGGDEPILSRDLYGFEDPYSPSEKRRLFEESPGFNADRVATPTLLVFGPHAGSVGEELYAQYRHFRVPTELLVYQDGHVFTQKPANVADSIVHEIRMERPLVGENRSPGTSDRTLDFRTSPGLCVVRKREDHYPLSCWPNQESTWIGAVLQIRWQPRRRPHGKPSCGIPMEAIQNQASARVCQDFNWPRNPALANQRLQPPSP